MNDKSKKKKPDLIAELLDEITALRQITKCTEQNAAQLERRICTAEKKLAVINISSAEHTLDTIEARLSELKLRAQTMITRITTLTEVTRYARVQAPEKAQRVTQKLIWLMDKDDKWWSGKEHVPLGRWLETLTEPEEIRQ